MDVANPALSEPIPTELGNHSNFHTACFGLGLTSGRRHLVLNVDVRISLRGGSWHSLCEGTCGVLVSYAPIIYIYGVMAFIKSSASHKLFNRYLMKVICGRDLSRKRRRPTGGCEDIACLMRYS